MIIIVFYNLAQAENDKISYLYVMIVTIQCYTYSSSFIVYSILFYLQYNLSVRCDNWPGPCRLQTIHLQEPLRKKVCAILWDWKEDNKIKKYIYIVL